MVHVSFFLLPCKYLLLSDLLISGHNTCQTDYPLLHQADLSGMELNVCLIFFSFGVTRWWNCRWVIIIQTCKAWRNYCGRVLSLSSEENQFNPPIIAAKWTRGLMGCLFVEFRIIFLFYNQLKVVSRLFGAEPFLELLRRKSSSMSNNLTSAHIAHVD